MVIGRFERKIAFAIAAVAFMPLLGALVLGARALGEAYAVGVNQQVETELNQSLVLYRTHFAALRQSAQRSASSVAQDFTLNRLLPLPPEDPDARTALFAALDALLASDTSIVSIEVQAPKAPPVRRTRTPAGADALRLLTLEETAINQPDTQIKVTVGTNAQVFSDYQHAGELVEVYKTLKRRSRYVSGSYLAVYIALLLSVIVVALGIGLTLSRRVTRRVAQLASATERVGKGDLTVSVPDDDQDEVGELTRAFNAMVRDMRESRDRIDYLSRIGAWQEFARRLAHEIKNPLTPIVLAVQEVHRSYKGDDLRFRRTLEDAHAIVEEEVATLRRLVGEFSEFARLPEARLSPADLCVFVQEATESMTRSPEYFGDDLAEVATIRIDVSRHPIPVQIDTMLLKRCVDNLVRNALQALRDAERRDGLVTVAARTERGHAVLEVSDNGPGIPDKARTSVFDPYYTTKTDGTGLGLPIVKKIVLEHGGEVRCGRAGQGGASIQLWLPLSPVVRPKR